MAVDILHGRGLQNWAFVFSLPPRKRDFPCVSPCTCVISRLSRGLGTRLIISVFCRDAVPEVLSAVLKVPPTPYIRLWSFLYTRLVARVSLESVSGDSRTAKVRSCVR